jgi:hypothetical protein
LDRARVQGGAGSYSKRGERGKDKGEPLYFRVP